MDFAKEAQIAMKISRAKARIITRGEDGKFRCDIGSCHELVNMPFLTSSVKVFLYGEAASAYWTPVPLSLWRWETLFRVHGCTTLPTVVHLATASKDIIPIAGSKDTIPIADSVITHVSFPMEACHILRCQVETCRQSVWDPNLGYSQGTNLNWRS
jgi:hypothetical protein